MTNTTGPLSDCHECGEQATSAVRVGRHEAGTCSEHAAIVEHVMRLQLGMASYLAARDAR